MAQEREQFSDKAVRAAEALSPSCSVDGVSKLRRIELGLEKPQGSPPDPGLGYIDGGLATVRDTYNPNATELELSSTRAEQDFPL